jgi:hypothetical protein
VITGQWRLLCTYFRTSSFRQPGCGYGEARQIQRLKTTDGACTTVRYPTAKQFAKVRFYLLNSYSFIIDIPTNINGITFKKLNPYFTTETQHVPVHQRLDAESPIR